MTASSTPAIPQQDIRVFVVEDHPVVRLGLKTMLESESGIQVIGMAASGREVLACIDQYQSDVILMDLRMPEMDGLTAIKHLRAINPAVRIVVLTNYHSDEDVVTAIQAGAMGYLLKSAQLEEVLSAIRTVHAGRRAIPVKIAEQLAESVGRARLSPRELEILELVSHGLTNPEIAELLSISDKTVRNHVINCLDKLGAKDRTEAAALALRRGLIAWKDPAP